MTIDQSMQQILRNHFEDPVHSFSIGSFVYKKKLSSFKPYNLAMLSILIQSLNPVSDA